MVQFPLHGFKPLELYIPSKAGNKVYRHISFMDV